MTVSAKMFTKGPGKLATLALAMATLAMPLQALADPESHDPRGGGNRGGGPVAQAPAGAAHPAAGGPARPAPQAMPAAAPAQGGWNGARPGGAQTPTAQGGWNGARPAGGPDVQRGNDNRGWNGGQRGGPDAQRGNDNRGWNGGQRGGQDVQRGNDNRGWNGGQRGGDNRAWSHDWRNDNRYDWQRWRTNNRMAFHLGRYYPPYRGYGYNRLSVGFFLQPLFYGDSYRIYDPWTYHLPAAYGPYQWVRYYDDAVLVNIYTGAVADVLYDFFW